MSFQADISSIAKIISDNNYLSDSEQTNFLNILEEAQATLSEGFGGLSNEDDSNKKFYDYAFNAINSEFDIFIKSIENIRSSYLPYNVYEGAKKTLDGDVEFNSIEEISSGSTPLESYQNAFFRMIGLPSWEDIEYNNPNALLSIVNLEGNLQEDIVNSQNIYNLFLDKRQAFSTLGCGAGITHFDLIAENSIEDFLKKNYNYSDEAFSEVQNFSTIIGRAKDADEDELEELTGLYNNYVSSLLSKAPEGSDDVDLFNKVSTIYSGDIVVGDPISWSELSLDSFIGENDEIFRNNYTGYLLFIHYGFISDNPYKFLTINDVIKVYNQLVLRNPSDDSLNNIEKNIYTYSSLLFPLVKDGRISRCINDSDKIVAEPFLPITKRVVNGRFLRSSLLESIIRIRTDVISGTTSYTDSSVPYTIGEDRDKEVNQKSVSGELLGYLESLLIIRMLDALETLANSTRNNIEQISSIQRRTGRGLFGSCSESVTSAVPDYPRTLTNDRVILNNYALIEDSIMLLLGTKDIDEDSLNLQFGVNRDSSVPNSYLMSSLINIVQIPRKYINNKIDKDERKSKTENSVGAKVAKDIEVSIGIRSGVGIVDLLAIILGLLTIEEVYLVALLTDSQRDSMYRQINKDTFDEDKIRQISEIPISTAINVLTERVNTIYKLFISFLIE
jgi:hypothetical protein